MSERPRLYYDGDCGFCRWALAWVLRWDRRHRIRPMPIESPEGDRELGDLGAARLESWHLVRSGQRWSGGRAFAPLLEELPCGGVPARLARRFERLIAAAYRWVADHRSALSKLVPPGSKKRADVVLKARRC